jgi:hypothetical protein
VAGDDLSRNHTEAVGERRMRHLVEEHQNIEHDDRDIDECRAAEPVFVVVAERYHRSSIRTRVHSRLARSAAAFSRPKDVKGRK